ncbi:MAG: DNA translocase FtsK [Paludibacteraceae bacterium]|nr:DNA translocase FtsK [Paludibacteraceae bacterium]
MAKPSKHAEKQTEEASSLGFFQKIKAFFSNDTVKFIIGVTLFAVGIFVLLSEISFIFSGREDYNLLTKGVSELQDEPKKFSNFCSSTGANIANIMINNWFGIPSILVPIFLLIAGHRLCNPDTKYSVLRHFINCFFLMIWTSVLLGAVIPNGLVLDFIRPGGLHGVIAADYISLLIGPIGLSLTLALTIIIYCAITFASFVPKVQSWLNVKNWESNKYEDFGQEGMQEEPADGIGDEIQDSDFKITDIPEEENPVEDSPIDDTPVEVSPLENVPVEDSHVEENTAIIETTDGPRNPDLEDTDTVTDTDSVGFAATVAKNEESEAVEQNTDLSLVEKYGEYDPTLELPNYKLPTYDLLKDYGQIVSIDEVEQQQNKEKIISTLKSYNVFVKDIQATIGPTITLYEIVPVEGTRINKIRNLGDDIAMSIAAKGIRIIAPMPGKGTIGIEVPNKKSQTVSMQSVLASKKFQETTYDLPVALGKTITDEVFMVDLCKLPHLLVAGATGQGKSVGLNAIITSLLYKKHPSQLKIVLVDPKKTEFSIYSDIDKHFLAKLPENDDAVITDVDKVIRTLQSVCKEMDTRNDLLKKAHVRNIKEYNAKFVKRELNPENGHHYLPYMVVIIDEYGDLIMTAGKEIEVPIARIAAVARAAGIHMVIATQRPSANIVTGLIKANFPARMAFKVASMVDSRTILDASGANQLIGRGDMLFLQGSDITRVQCAFVDTPEVEDICNFIADQKGYPDVFALPEVEMAEDSGDTNIKGVDLTKDRDPFFAEVARMIVLNQDASVSMIQRKFSIGFNRAGRLMDQMEAAGIVGPSNGSKKRDIYVGTETELENLINNL